MTTAPDDGANAAAIAALAGVLSRRFCGTSQPPDEQLALGLVGAIDRSADALMIAAATATWAAFGHAPDELPDEAWSTAAAIVRSLDNDTATTETTTFAAAALAVLAAAGRTRHAADDLVRAANMARRTEQHALAAACARAALAIPVRCRTTGASSRVSPSPWPPGIRPTSTRSTRTPNCFPLATRSKRSRARSGRRSIRTAGPIT